MDKQVLAATQTPGEKGNRWFQGTADAVRQFIWVFEVGDYDCIFTKHCILVISIIRFCLIHEGCQEQEYWAYIDTVRWSSLPDGLYGFSAGNYLQPLTVAIVHLVLMHFWKILLIDGVCACRSILTQMLILQFHVCLWMTGMSSTISICHSFNYTQTYTVHIFLSYW